MSRHLCTECDTVSEAPPCACGNASLMDLDDPDITLMLQEEHERAVARHGQRLIVASIPLGVTAVLLIAEFVPQGGRLVNFLPFGAGFVLWCCAMTWAASLAVGKLWRGPKTPAYLT